MKVEINLEDYLDRDEMKHIAETVAYGKFSESTTPVETMLSNATYEIVKKHCEETLGIDAMKKIQDETRKLATDESSLKFCLFYDGSKYGSFDKTKGIALKVAENYLLDKCIERVQKVVDKILDNMKFDTKKFEQMVVKEAARMVAEKMTTNQK
jgi:hypothetical protein